MKGNIGLADFTNKFAIRLKELRTEAGLKQEELGEKIGVQRMTIYRWENGSNPPSDENLLLLAQLFNTSTLYLRGDIDDRDMVLTDDWKEAKELLREADEELLLGVSTAQPRDEKIRPIDDKKRSLC
ncbi:MAG: helix-turn-helix transcriptional regulator [Clostridia bacterium]|nr:helix-turn-helix transcriptional regulator [Clostridia bacterium]